jgi:hypothetical protein
MLSGSHIFQLKEVLRFPDVVKMPVCVLVLLVKTKLLLSSIMSIQAILTKLFIEQI